MTSQILHQTSWAKSPSGKSIELFEAHNHSPNFERPLLFIGGVHGDEPEGVELAQKLLLWLQKNNSKNLYSWILIPCLNVEGYANNCRTNSRGVDLNRNFPSSDWSTEHRMPRYYPGPHPNSEPEVQALVSLIQERRPYMITHFHSWEPCVVYTGAPGQRAAQLLAQDTEYSAREDIGYPTPGSLGQFGWQSCQTPVICIEAQEKSDLHSIWPKFSSGLIRLLSRGSLGPRILE